MIKAAESASSALDRFRGRGRGYVEFALRYPQHFAVMFEVSLAIELYPVTKQAGERAFGTLVPYVEACQAERKFCRREIARLSPCWHGRWFTE